MSGVSRTIVSALVEHEGALLLVREALAGHPDQWVLPGGVVEPGELADRALAREVREETGLELDGEPQLAFLAQHTVAEGSRWDGTWTVLTFRARVRGGSAAAPLPEDPDRLVLEAAWVPRAEAAVRMAAHPARRRSASVLAHLDGSVPPGALWLWSGDWRDAQDEPVVVLPGAGLGAAVTSTGDF